MNIYIRTIINGKIYTNNGFQLLRLNIFIFHLGILIYSILIILGMHKKFILKKIIIRWWIKYFNSQQLIR